MHSPYYIEEVEISLRVGSSRIKRAVGIGLGPVVFEMTTDQVLGVKYSCRGNPKTDCDINARLRQRSYSSPVDSGIRISVFDLNELSTPNLSRIPESFRRGPDKLAKGASEMTLACKTSPQRDVCNPEVCV